MKKDGVVAHCDGPGFNPLYCKRKQDQSATFHKDSTGQIPSHSSGGLVGRNKAVEASISGDY